MPRPVCSLRSQNLKVKTVHVPIVGLERPYACNGGVLNQPFLCFIQAHTMRDAAGECVSIHRIPHCNLQKEQVQEK